MSVFTDNRSPIAGSFRQISIGSTITTIDDIYTLGRPHKGNVCLIQIDPIHTLSDQNQALRYTEEGTNPTVTSGMCMGVADWREFTNVDQIRNLKMICAEPGQTVTINIQFYNA